MCPPRPAAFCLSVSLLIALATPNLARAAWPQNPGANLPVIVAGFSQQQPVAIPDGTGGAILAWTDGRNGLEDDVYVQRITASGALAWNPVGVNLTGSQPNNQNVPAICSDGAGGAIIAWIDARTYSTTLNDIYVQRVNANGVVQWTAGGVAVCTQAAEQQFPRIAPDGSGGAIVAWTDLRSGTGDIYARRISAAGVPQGTTNGIAICTASGWQSDVRIVSDGQSGALMTWQDSRADGGDIYVQRLLSINFVDPNFPVNGRALCTATGAQSYPEMIADGAGGAIVAWSDSRGGAGNDVYAHHVQASGAADPAWPGNGTPVCTQTQEQILTSITSDGQGGALLTWTDNRFGSLATDVYVQHLLSGGLPDPVWPSNGLSVCNASGQQLQPVIVDDGSGGAFVSWTDTRFGLSADIYAHHVLSSGAVDAAWPANGRAMCNATGLQQASVILADGTGGAIVTWQDERAGNKDIYCQRVARFGALGSPEPRITSVRDVPNDQGGRVNVAWTASYLDTDPNPSVGQYWVLRALGYSNLPSTRMRPAIAIESLPPTQVGQLRAGTVITSATLGPTYYWELIGNISALHLVSGYGSIAGTTGDSTGAYNPRTHFMVVAWNQDGTQYWASAPDSGYSVDNLPPGTPAPFTGQYGSGATAMHWDPNPEADLAFYRLYRGTTAGFVPGPANLVASPADTGYVDPAGAPYFYRLTAVDSHGNESGSALLSPAGALDAGGIPRPLQVSLSPPSPNPARGATTLRFTLAHEGPVRLTLHDASGRLVRSLIQGSLAGEEHLVGWDGRDDRGVGVRGGLYFARLEAGGRSEVARLVWLR